MASSFRIAVAVVLAGALAVTFVLGYHRNLGLSIAKSRLPDRPLPSVSAGALERGCAAWGEALASCLEKPGLDPFRERDARRF